MNRRYGITLLHSLLRSLNLTSTQQTRRRGKTLPRNKSRQTTGIIHNGMHLRNTLSFLFNALGVRNSSSFQIGFFELWSRTRNPKQRIKQQNTILRGRRHHLGQQTFNKMSTLTINGVRRTLRVPRRAILPRLHGTNGHKTRIHSTTTRRHRLHHVTIRYIRVIRPSLVPRDIIHLRSRGTTLPRGTILAFWWNRHLFWRHLSRLTHHKFTNIRRGSRITCFLRLTTFRQLCRQRITMNTRTMTMGTRIRFLKIRIQLLVPSNRPTRRVPMNTTTTPNLRLHLRDLHNNILPNTSTTFLRTRLHLTTRILPLFTTRLNNKTIQIDKPRTITINMGFPLPLIWNLHINLYWSTMSKTYHWGFTLFTRLYMTLLPRPTSKTLHNKNIRNIRHNLRNGIANGPPRIKITPIPRPRVPRSTIRRTIRMNPKRMPPIPTMNIRRPYNKMMRYPTINNGTTTTFPQNHKRYARHYHWMTLIGMRLPPRLLRSPTNRHLFPFQLNLSVFNCDKRLLP